MTRSRGIDQIADRFNRVALLANDKTDVALAELDLEHHLLRRLDFRYHHLVRKLDETTDNEFYKFFHVRLGILLIRG